MRPMLTSSECALRLVLLKGALSLRLSGNCPFSVSRDRLRLVLAAHYSFIESFPAFLACPFI